MDKTKNNFYSWVACITVSLFFLYEFLQATMLDSISGDMMKEFHINALQLANISAYYFYSNILFLIPAGLLLDRVKVKWVTCFSICMSIFGIALLSIASSYEFAKLARFVSGVSGAFCFLCCLRIVSLRFSFDKFPIVIGVLVTMAFVGGLLSHVPFALLSEYFGWRAALHVFVMLGFFILGLNLFLLREDSQETVSLTSRLHFKNIFRDLISVLSNRYTWIGGVYTAMLNLPVILLGSLWSSLYLIEIEKLSSITAAFVSSGIFFGLMVGSPLVGYYAKSTSNIKKTMAIGSVASLLLILFLIGYNGGSIHLMFALFFMLGFFSSSQSLGYSIVMGNSEPSVSSLASSITSIIVLGGGTLLKVLFGILLDLNWKGVVANNIRIYSDSDFHHAMMILPSAFMLCLVLAIYYRPNQT